jgi:hypothetical protein
MNIAKNMEAIFVVAAALAGVTAYATAAEPARYTMQVTEAVSATANPAMHTVVITAKRLTAAEKAAL